MANRFSTWFKGLSTVGKVLISAAVVGTSGIVLAGASAPSPQTTTTTTHTVEVKIETEEEIIPFDTKEVKDSSLAKGKEKVTTKGVDGRRVFTYEVEYTDGVETKRTLLKEEVTKPATQVTSIGTYVAPKPRPALAPASSRSNCDPNYSGCVPIASDVDCIGGSGDGPAYTGYTTVIGYDIYGLDRDGDGIACE